MGWLTSVGEFCGSFGANFIERRARTKRRGFGSSKADGDLAAYTAVTEGLKECLPIDDHVTRRGLKAVCHSLKKNDHFGAQLAIDSNPGSYKREICVYLLKSVVVYLCSENPSDLVRAATYTMIACK